MTSLGDQITPCAAAITIAPLRTDQPSGKPTATIAGRPRVRYHRRTCSTASGSGRPGSPIASALLARPVKPSAARSVQLPSGSCSVARQPSAATRSSSSIEIVIAAHNALDGDDLRKLGHEGRVGFYLAEADFLGDR